MKKKRSRAGERVYTVFFMFIVTLVFISALTFVHLATRHTVALNENLAFRRALFAAAGFTLPQDPAAAEAAWKARVTEEPGPDGLARAYRVGTPVEATNALPFYRVVRTSGAGLWGRITALVGFDPAAASISGVEFIEHGETPGLGARIDEPWFKTQLRGKRGPVFRILAEKSGIDEPDAFDAITGATVTTLAVKDILEKAIREARTPAGGE